MFIAIGPPQIFTPLGVKCVSRLTYIELLKEFLRLTFACYKRGTPSGVHGSRILVVQTRGVANATLIDLDFTFPRLKHRTTLMLMLRVEEPQRLTFPVGTRTGRSLHPAVPGWRGRRRLHHLASALLLILWCTTLTGAMPRDEYQKHLGQAIIALDSLVQFDEGETQTERSARIVQTLSDVRSILPETQDVEWRGVSFKVDNSWLHRQLAEYEKASDAERANLLTFTIERLQAIQQRLAESENAGAAHDKKAEATSKLAEILNRPEYARASKEPGALSRLLSDFWKWLRSLIPKPQRLAPGNPSLFTTIAQILVILLALAAIAYAVKQFAPRVFQRRGAKRKDKPRARVVLGERLEPDQSAGDLLAEAEALAMRGELQAAIRKAYIALLVELGDRKILSLAQYKTNRDYLSAVREIEPLHGNVKQLTESFERHWYGLVSATEADWLAFRAGYKLALLQ